MRWRWGFVAARLQMSSYLLFSAAQLIQPVLISSDLGQSRAERGRVTYLGLGKSIERTF
jgi:hypothetical protein